MINHHYNFPSNPVGITWSSGDGGRGDISSTPHGGGVLKENWLPNNCQGLIGGSGEFNRETIQILQSLSLIPLPLPGDKY